MPPQGRPQAAGRSSQFQPGKRNIFPGRGMSNQKASQKPARSHSPLFLIARSQPNQLIWQGWALQGVKEAQPFSGRPRRSTPLGCFASPRVELCHLLCFVCGRGSLHKAAPRQRGGPARQGDV